MKQLLVGLSLALGVFFITPAPVAHAWSWSSFFGKSSDSQKSAKTHRKNYQSSKSRHHRHSHKRSGSRSVPELDPSAAGSAIVLLLGGGAYVLSRRREQDLA